MSPGRKAVLRVVVFRTGHLGDTVCAIPAFRLLRAHFGDAGLTLLCDEPAPGMAAARDVAEGLNVFDRIVTYCSGRGWRTWLELFRAVRRLRPDVVVQLPQLQRTHRSRAKQRLFFRLAGVRRLHGFRPWVCAGEPRPNEAVRLVRLLHAEGIAGEKPDYAFPADEAASASVRAKMVDIGIEMARPYIVFCGGGKASTQRWPLERYAAVLEHLSLETGFPVAGIGGSSDAEAYAKEIIPRFPDLRVLKGPLPIGELAEVLRRARCYVGNDTGPMHLAAAVGRPIIAIMSARNRLGEWDPDVEARLLIRHRTECEGCRLEACARERHRCMTAITVDSVAEKAASFIGSLASEGNQG